MNPDLVPHNRGRSQPPPRQVRVLCIDPPTEDQRLLARAQPDRKLRFSTIMPVGQNPRQAVGECCYLVGLRGICLISEILALYPPVEIFSCRGLAGRLPQYFKRAIVNLIAIVIEKFAYGLSYQVGSQYTSLAQRAADYENRHDVQAMDHFQMYVQRYANYIFNWIIPYVSVRVNSDNVFNCNPRTWIENMRRRSNHPDQNQTGSNRSGLPLWSSKYVFDLIVNGRLTLGDRQMCKGHNLQVAVLCHKLFPFYDAVVPAANNLPHYVDEDEDVTTMFDDAYTMKFCTEPGI